MNLNQVIVQGVMITRAQIDDEFEGFDDNMLFALSNGEYWIQVSYTYWYHYSYRPNITIYSVDSTFYLNVDGENECAEVALLKDVQVFTIVSDFRGWTGKTSFQMNNGQVWQQTEYAYHYAYAYRPQAIIYRASGGYRMQVAGQTIGVKRLS